VVSVKPSSGATFQISTTANGEFSFTGRDQVRYIMQVDGTKATTIVTSKGYLSLKAEQKLEVYCAIDSLCIISTACCLSPIKDQEISFPAVLYELNSAELLPEARDSLDYLYRLLSENPHIVIELAAHTDCRGSMQDNLLLSQRRAQACVDYLVKEKGIDPKRLVAKGYGEGNPLRLGHKTVISEAYINAQPENQREVLHQLNRRTVFRIIAVDFDLKADPAQEVKVKKGFFDDSAPVGPHGQED
jgi:peptidoglycan-associated lipoprotein